ncbi:sigma-54-dependent transcriptional regulator [Bacillus horti]|uniref:Two-component system response regulator AtoC n=1 Tax=Caldalkalibacillus horti TaxID=77523 RepID=A0ABT9VU74_9BACI|nr:sigma-54 dependent transcriptional regulator [Bacillus horti]MDQ0164435.1 two-component system response regulator AtoC [Bacillus horti]
MNQLLIIDDELSICSSLQFAMEDDYHVLTTTDPHQGIQWIKQKTFDVCLLDLKIGSVNGLDVLQELKADQPDLIVIIMTAYGSISSSVDAIKKGAYSYVTKPVNVDEIHTLIKQALHVKKLNSQVEYLSQELEKKYGYQGMIGKSSSMRKIYQLIGKLKDIDTNVCITGESGTGKELVARAIHFSGKRKKEHFEVVNCAAIPEHLLESELFGHEKGAFTGAVTQRMGKFQIANQGSIFLDEIGDMPLTLQSKLLRVIQQREVTPLGSNDAVQLNVRVIAATNRDLKEAVRLGEFREDLYFRLNVIELELPPLRDRKDDLPFLLQHFIQKFNLELGKEIKGFSPEAFEIIMHYDYPGNVRELANIVEAAMVITEGEHIVAEDLAKQIRLKANFSIQKQNIDSSIKSLIGKSLKEIEKEVILQTLELHKGHRKKTADTLGISERGLRDKLKNYKKEEL